ncbi:protein NEDD1-like isoform X1 [Dermacentor andersoni]|uniref:protein NEDD1-like isoform X1 n=2 Tax=Dermacentor andersoni TaxID=34620 RepID=UPI003B3A7F50
MFATAGEDVLLWSCSTLQPCLRFEVDKSRTVSSVSWSADGRRLASISQLCKFVHVTEFSRSRHRHLQIDVEGACVCSQFSHQDCHSMCVGLLDGTVQLLKNGKTSYSYQPHKEKVTCIAFSSNDGFVASGAYDGSVALLSVDIRNTKMLNEPTGRAVVGLQWSPHSCFKLVTTSTDGFLYIWDTSTRRLKNRYCLHPERGASGLSLSPVNESLVVTVGHDSRLVLFDMLTASEQAFVLTPEPLESVAFLPDGQRVIGGATSGRVYLYDLRNTRQTPPNFLGSHLKPVTAIAAMHSVQAEQQMMAFVNASAANGNGVSAASSVQSQRELPVRFSLGSDAEAAGDLVMASTPNGDAPTTQIHLDPGKPLKLPTSPKDAANLALSPGDVFQEGAESRILDASWVSAQNSSTSPRRRSFRLSDFMPVLNDSLPSSETGNSSVTRLSVQSARQEKSQAAAALPGLPHVNGTQGPTHSGRPTNRDASSASSNSVPSIPEEPSQNIQVEGSPGIDVERQPYDPTLAARVSLLENMLENHTRNTESLLAEQTRHIDAHLRHIHIQVTLMEHSFMRDIQGMLQQVFDEVAALRADIADLRNDV